VIITNRSNEFLIDTFDTILQETGCTIKRFLNPEPEPMYDEAASGTYKAVITSLFFPVQWGWSTPRCHGPFIRSVMSGYYLAHPETIPVFISWDSPAHLYELAFMDPFLVTYGSTPYAQEAAAKALLGKIPITGKVPVSVEGLFKRGDGLQRR
jgi:beta-N-acetylhexosaminidase